MKREEREKRGCSEKENDGVDRVRRRREREERVERERDGGA